jgi:hypothetical protein
MSAVLRWILYVSVMAAALCGVAMAIDPELAAWALATVGQHAHDPYVRLLAGAVGGVVLASELLLVGSWLRERRFAREFSYTTTLGQVSVGLVAIEEALTRALANETAVRRAGLRVVEDRVKRVIQIHAHINLWEEDDIKVAIDRCQSVLAARFRELMPQQKFHIGLNLHRLTPRRPEPAGRRRTEVGDRPAVAPVAPVTPLATAVAVEPELAPKSLPWHDDQTFRDDGTIREEDLYLGPRYPVESRDDDTGTIRR